ncbi:SDR family oxidoreductase [Paenibacillus sp. FSL H7-0350]|uniref:SDR family oxidoreductase n=1 Tax=Paenibacillus sp. FSL H7-0350 TaxID=2975345 RepID=UPI003158931F
MVIIVTGHSRGVGSEIVKKILTDTNYTVLGISRASHEIFKGLYEEYGERFHHITYDLSDMEGIKDLYFNKLKLYGPIVGLVNNSAVAYDDLVTNLNMDQLTEMFQVNVFAAMQLTKYVIRDMLLNKCKGSIVFISSVSVHTSYKGLSMYAATKGAVEAFSKGVAREWGKLGIRSNCIVAGFMDTSMSSTLSEEQKMRIYQRTSLKKKTSIESVAETALFLLTEKSESITGGNIFVDNGTI